MAEGKANKETAIHKTAFWVLGATVRDNSRRIMELAEEKALHFDHDACQKARAELTNPRTRLSAELSWFPGVSPAKAREVAELLLRDPSEAVGLDSLPTLAKANLMASAFEAVSGDEDPGELAGFILDFARVADDLDAEEILRDLNEDRAVSGFPEVKGVETVESELVERLRSYRGTIRDALNNMESDRLVVTMTKAAHAGTDDGKFHAPVLLDELIDAYETETQGFLAKEAENLSALIAKAREVAPAGEESVGKVLDRIEKVARNWDRVAQPIQISMKARGIAHRPSMDLAWELRGLGVDLFNKHDMMGAAKRMTSLLAELFDELPEVVETLEKDSQALSNISSREEMSIEEAEKWKREISFEAEIGIVFKDSLKISTTGVQWKGKSYPLDSVTRVRWGGVRHSVNGIPTGTDFTMAFGDNLSEAVVQTKKEALYTEFTEKLWKAVCTRLMTDLLKALRDGKRFAFGEAVVDDAGVELVEHHTFKADKRVYCPWAKVRIWNADGNFFMGMSDDTKRTYASASYINDANTHLLEHLVRLNFKGSDPRLSDIMK